MGDGHPVHASLLEDSFWIWDLRFFYRKKAPSHPCFFIYIRYKIICKSPSVGRIYNSGRAAMWLSRSCQLDLARTSTGFDLLAESRLESLLAFQTVGTIPGNVLQDSISLAVFPKGKHGQSFREIAFQPIRQFRTAVCILLGCLTQSGSCLIPLRCIEDGPDIGCHFMLHAPARGIFTPTTSG